MQQVLRERIIAGAALGALPLLIATGCAAAISADEVAEQSSAILTEQVGEAPDDVTCPEDLPAEEGAEVRCEVVAEGLTYGATVTVTEVDGNDVHLDIVVDDTPE